MLPLDDQYKGALAEVQTKIHASEEYKLYLEEEEDSYYKTLQDVFEPQIAEIYNYIAEHDPLQLVAFEKALLDEEFEGLFLPKVLGYSVLRGVITDQFKYMAPQEHFKDVLVTMCHSANFEQLRKRIGMSIQIGFALSSDIWITNLIDQIENKRIRYFLQTMKIEAYRDLAARKIAYERYLKQFRTDNYFCTDFPSTFGELKVHFPSFRFFLDNRIKKGYDNSSFAAQMLVMVERPEFFGSAEHIQSLGLYANFFNLQGEYVTRVAALFNRYRTDFPNFPETYLQFLYDTSYRQGLPLDAACDRRMSAILDPAIEDQLTEYYKLTDFVHGLGFVHPDAIDEVKKFYNRHEGLSTINSCVRMNILNQITHVIANLTEPYYHDYFDLMKINSRYMAIFSNEHFNQDIERYSMTYVKACLRRFTDKRSKEYQEIKRFVASVFVDLKFISERDVVEMFKTRRKKRKAAAE